ncbi:autotransporter outer membrane beta-barrel domain-containing protein [Sutterella wadsworthensis]|uniref:autotransporter outer membrane beta-barrel domain-containing protein n=1 Tax=Sutterella wadsworthensis TaxID=40545 RepID=UPI003AB947CD
MTDVQQVNFGTQNKRFQGDQAINSWGGGKLDFSGIKTLAFYTDGGQAINMQSTSSLSIKEVDTLILDNYRSLEGDPERIYSAIQLMVMAGDDNDASTVQPTIDVDVGNLVIKADSKYTQSAGISVTDQTTDYQGTSSIKGSFTAKNISIDGGTYGIRSNRSTENSRDSVLDVTAENSLVVNGGKNAVWLNNEAGHGITFNAEAANATFTGGEEGVLSENGTASIKADSLTVSGDKSALNFDKGSSLTLANKTDSQTANTTLNGNVTIAGSATFKNQDINQTAGTFHVSTLDASNSKLTFNTTENGGVTVGTLTGDLKLEAGASVTEKLGSAEKVAGALDSIIGGGAASTLKDNFVGGEASDMTGAWKYDAATGDVSYEGSRLSPTLTAVTHANAANLAQWRYEVNHLSERLGDVRSQNGALGAWARVYGTDAKVSDSVSTKFTNNTIQVGGDAKVGDTWIVGAAFGYTDNSTDFSNGSADSDGYTLSVYGTAVLPTGSYLDLIGRVGRISTDIDVSTVTPFKASYDNTTVGLSAEVGHRFDLSQIFYVTPQAELAYGRVFGDDYTGSNGMKVSQDDFDTLIARIGFQAGANFADNRGSIYLTASVNHDFLGDTDATASKAGAQDQKLKEDLGGTWFSYGIGAQFSTTNNLSFYGSLTRANGSDYQEDYHYSVGARYVF